MTPLASALKTSWGCWSGFCCSEAFPNWGRSVVLPPPDAFSFDWRLVEFGIPALSFPSPWLFCSCWESFLDASLLRPSPPDSSPSPWLELLGLPDPSDFPSSFFVFRKRPPQPRARRKACLCLDSWRYGCSNEKVDWISCLKEKCKKNKILTNYVPSSLSPIYFQPLL